MSDVLSNEEVEDVIYRLHTERVAMQECVFAHFQRAEEVIRKERLRRPFQLTVKLHAVVIYPPGTKAEPEDQMSPDVRVSR